MFESKMQMAEKLLTKESTQPNKLIQNFDNVIYIEVNLYYENIVKWLKFLGPSSTKILFPVILKISGYWDHANTLLYMVGGIDALIPQVCTFMILYSLI